jgi:DNA modification methylase
MGNFSEVIQYSWGNDARINVPSLDKDSLKINFADPPYNIGVKYADDLTKDKRNDHEYQCWAEHVIDRMTYYTMPGGTVWWLCPEAHGDFIGPILSKIVGPRVHRVVWYETFAQYQQKSLTADYRFIFCHQKPGGPLTFNPDAIRIPSDWQIKYKDKRANPDGRVPGQVWQVRRLQGTSDDHVDWHKAQLPPELLDRIIRGWSNEDDLVSDAFGGSGNFGLASLRNKRNSYLVEQSPTYCEKIKDRLTQFVHVV